MRFPHPLLFCAALCALVAGCGSSGSMNSVQSTQTPSGTLTGNWQIALFPSNTLQTAPQVGGYMTNTNNAVSGTLLMQGLACASTPVSLPIAGTITPEGSVSFTGNSTGGLKLTFTGTYDVVWPPPPGPYDPLNGSYTISGGCTSSQNGSMAGLTEATLYPGNYTGTFQSASGNSFGVSLPIVQSGPDADGEYTVASGVVTFTGSPCFSTGTITSSNVFGGSVDVTVSLNNNATLEITGEHPDVPTPFISVASYRVTGGACVGDTGSGTLTRTAS